MKGDSLSSSIFQVLRKIEKEDGVDHLEGSNVSLKPTKELTFPVVDTVVMEKSESGLDISLSFMGLYGVDAPLPLYLTEALMQENTSSKRMRDFLDIFNHRFYLILYLAWKRGQPDISAELGDNYYFTRLLQLTGGVVSEDRNQTLVKYYAKNCRSLEGLNMILIASFDEIAASSQWRIYEWHTVESHSLSKGKHYALGHTSFLGNHQLTARKGCQITIQCASEEALIRILSKKNDIFYHCSSYLGPYYSYYLRVVLLPERAEIKEKHKNRISVSTWLNKKKTTSITVCILKKGFNHAG